MKSIEEKVSKFLKSINEKDKVLIIHHDDLDGFASGILLYDYCKKKKAHIESLCFTIGETRLSELNLKKFNKILITDISPNLIYKDLEKLKDKEIFYTDHHRKNSKIPNFVLEYRTLKHGYIPSSRTVYELVGGKKWLAVAGVIGDAGELYEENKRFIGDFFTENKYSLEEFREKVSLKISNFLIYFSDNCSKAFKILSGIKFISQLSSINRYSRIIDEEIQKYIQDFYDNYEKIGKAYFYVFRPKHRIKSLVTDKISFNRVRKIFVIGEKINGKVFVSARNQDGRYDMVKLMEYSINGLQNATAGGHPRAAGATFNESDLENFKKNLRNFFKKCNK